MKRRALVVLAVAALVLTGCRRTDVREMTIELPEMATEVDRDKIVRSLEPLVGLKRESLVFDMAGRRLTLGYDSMLIAHKNIEIAIAEAGYTANSIKAIRESGE